MDAGHPLGEDGYLIALALVMLDALVSNSSHLI